MDDDHVDDIYDYFKESETDDLETAWKSLAMIIVKTRFVWLE